jgi:hypothetical protein
MLTESDACASLRQHGRERCLLHLEGLTAQIIATQLNEVESIHKDGGVDPVATQVLEPDDPKSPPTLKPRRR